MLYFIEIKTPEEGYYFLNAENIKYVEASYTMDGPTIVITFIEGSGLTLTYGKNSAGDEYYEYARNSLENFRR